MHHIGYPALKRASKLTGRDAINKLPGHITVGPFDMEIVRMDACRSHAEESFGQFRAAEQQILIQHDMPTAIKAVDTFIHEVNHAIYWTHNMDDKDEEERIVATMATAWVQIYRANPWLAKWIDESIR